MRYKVVLALCSTVIVLTATAQAGWWHRHHRCPHCSGYGGSTVGVASTGGEFSSAAGESYVVRTVPERARYYAVSERLLADPLEFRSSRSTEEAAKEAAREEIGRIEAEKVRVREAAREAIAEQFGSSRGPGAEAARETDIAAIISLAIDLFGQLRGGRGGGLLGGGGDADDCEQRLAELQRQLRNLERNPSRRSGEDRSSNGSGRTIRRSYDPGRENSSGADVDWQEDSSAEDIKLRAEELAAERAERVKHLEKELEVLKSISISVQQQPPPPQN